MATYSSIAKKDVRFFSSPKDFESIFERHIKNQPIKNLSYVSLEFFKQSILDNPNSDCVLFSVRSGCPDCTYCIPNCLLPYTRSNNLKRPIYIIDLEDFYTTSAEEYKIVKSTLQLTKESSEDFGYGDGYVPTYQYWKNGKLEDAGVFANDETYYDYNVSYNDIITTSYFDGNRPTKFTDTNLIGTEISYYNSDYLIHSQILEKFLSYYC